MVYVCFLGVAISGVVVIVVVSVLFFVFDFLRPWLSVSNMKLLLFGSGAAAFIILVVLPLTTSIHLPSYCSLLFPCPSHHQLLLSSFLSSFAALALCFGHFSSFPLSNSFMFTYFSPICLHTLAYLKHTAFLFHMHWLVENCSGCCIFPYFLQYLHVVTTSTAFFFGFALFFSQ